MIRDLAMKPFQSSFLSAEKDTDIILRKLFIESKPYSDILKSLLVVNTNDCLDNYQKSEYKKVIERLINHILTRAKFAKDAVSYV